MLMFEKFLSPLDVKTKCKRQIGLQNMQLKGAQAVGRDTEPHSGPQIQFVLYHPDEDGHCITAQLCSGLVSVLSLRWPLGLPGCVVWWDQSSVGMGRALPGSPALPQAGQRHKRNVLVNAQGHFISCGGVSLIEGDCRSGEFLTDDLRCGVQPHHLVFVVGT